MRRSRAAAAGTAGSAWQGISIFRRGTSSIGEAKEQAAKADELCGKIGLVGAALSDYPDIGELCSAIEGGVSVSSLRADSVSEALIDRLAKSGHKTIAIAPEAGSERLRKVINKGVTEEDILRAADLVFGSGIPNLKLYFILGLPTETQEDVDAIIALAQKVREVQLKHARPAGQDRQDHALGELLCAEALHAVPVGARWRPSRA